jgi:hypothetical protein
VILYWAGCAFNEVVIARAETKLSAGIEKRFREDFIAFSFRLR